MKEKETQRFYIPELDGLRFIAFLLVFIHNTPYLESNSIWKALHEYGRIGVDLFFCLSAFLITKLLVLEYQQEGKINIRNFHFRRILRIWPLYFIYIAIALIFSIQKSGWDHLALHLTGLFTFTFNFAYLLLSPRVIVLFIHLWTISYEEQFYVVIPWFLSGLLRISEKSKVGILVLLLIMSLSARALFIYFNIKHPAIYMLPFTHSEAMLGGVAIGLGLFDRLFKKIQGWILILLGILSNSVVFLLPNIYEIGWSLMPTYLLSGFGMTLIVFSAINKESAFIGAFLNNKTLIYLGKISYGLYVFHLISNFLAGHIFIIIFGAVPQDNALYTLFVFITGLILTILFSSASWNWIEKPFLKWKKRYSLIPSRPV